VGTAGQREEEEGREKEIIASFSFYLTVRLLIRGESVSTKEHSLDVQTISVVAWGQEHKL